MRLIDADELEVHEGTIDDWRTEQFVYKDDIDDAPTIENPKWIPVTERLPEDGTYLVTIERIVGTSTSSVDMKSFAKDLNKVNKFNFPKKCGWYDYDSEYGYWEETRVIAWMPLPKPYKAKSEDKE